MLWGSGFVHLGRGSCDCDTRGQSQGQGDLNAGLLLCDQLLDQGVRGRFRAEVLRYKALFMMRTHDGWALIAVAHLKEALALSRRSPGIRAKVLQTLVTVYAKSGSCDLARPYADQLLALAAETPAADIIRFVPRIWFAMGYGHEAVGEYQQAEEAYRKALETVDLDGDQKLTAAMVKFNLAQVLLALGKAAEAMDILTEVRPSLNLDRYGSHILDAEAQCLLAMEYYDQAMDLCQRALKHSSCSDRMAAHIYFTMARLFLAQGDYQQAVESAERALGLAIKNPVARLIYKIEALRIELSRKKEVS